MKILAKIFLAAALVCAANAYFVDHHQNYQNDLNILGALDIESSYLKDKHFLQIKEADSSEYKKHLKRAIKEQYDNIVILQDILKKEQVPTEILYLAVIESGLKNVAHSNKGAAGIWQLVPRTARAMGLRVGGGVDERLDTVASTKAAAKYLSKLKKDFGKWYLAIMAYNCGDGALKKAIARAGSDDIRVLLDPEKKYVGLETRNFLRKIIITAQMANDLNTIMGDDTKLFNNPTDVKMAKIDLNSPKLSPKIPEKTAQKVAKNNKKAQKIAKNYSVQKGDTMVSIAKKFSVPLKDLVKANLGTRLSAGVSIVIPR